MILFILIVIIIVFCVFSCIRQEKAPKLVTGIARRSYGMYLMHMFFLAPISAWIVGGDIADPAVPGQLAIPLIAVLSYTCCVLATKLISYIPGSKWLIGC